MPTADSNPLLGAWPLQCWDISCSDGRAPTYPYGTDATWARADWLRRGC